MWDAADGKLVDMSSDTLPGLPTQEQIIEMRAKGVQPTRQGGFGYLRGPDDAMIENAQSGTVERFNHVHMYHEHPLCAIQWYVTHLGATDPRGTGGAPVALDGCELQTAVQPADVAVVLKFPGFVREPSGSVLFDDINILITAVAGRGPRQPARVYRRSLGSQRRRFADSTVARLKSEGIKFLEEIHAWGNTRRP